jgi:hypothetical protein
MSDSTDNLPRKIREWLDKQGYPLEMRVARALSSLQDDDRFLSSIVQSSIYSDPDTENSREIDVEVHSTDIFGGFEFKVFCECKKSSRPWVVFTSQRTAWHMSRIRAFAVTSKTASEVLARRIMECREVPWFCKGERIGYGLREAFNQNVDTPFKAIQSSVKAAVSELRRSRNRSSGDHFAFIFPVLVVEAPLFECYLDEEGAPQLQEIASGHLSCPLGYEDCFGTSVRVCRDSALSELVGDLQNIRESLFALLQPDLAEFEKRLRSG